MFINEGLRLFKGGKKPIPKTFPKDRKIHGMPTDAATEFLENVSQRDLELLQNLNKSTFDKSLESVNNFIKILNDENLLPPHGTRILPNPANIPENILDKSKIVFLALTILGSVNVNNVEASDISNDSKSSKQIEWALDALEAVDPMVYLEFQNEKNEQRSPDSKFSSKDKTYLTWNLYHEARGENGEGILAVLLTSFNRMKSKNYPSSAAGVIFDKYQNSWTLSLTNEKFNKRKVDISTFLKLRELVEMYSNEQLNFGLSIQSLISKIKQIKGENIDTDFTHYHKLGMLDDERFLVEVKSEATFLRILYLEQLYHNNDPRIVKFDNHIFYKDISPPKNYKTILSAAEQEKYKKWRNLIAN